MKTEIYPETVLLIYRNAKILFRYCIKCKMQNFIYKYKFLCCETITRDVSYSRIPYLEELNEGTEGISENLSNLSERIQNKTNKKSILRRRMQMGELEQKASKKLRKLMKICKLNRQDVLTMVENSLINRSKESQ